MLLNLSEELFTSWSSSVAVVLCSLPATQVEQHASVLHKDALHQGI